MTDWDEIIDCEGLLCPLPVLRARKRLLALALRARHGLRPGDRCDGRHRPAALLQPRSGHAYLEARTRKAR
jgi:tRNA 2-thiouridine synthesizing protein A